MSTRRKVPNELALATLAWLLREPMHPYELGRRMRETGQDRHVRYNRSSLYMVVEQLRKAGFIAGRETAQSGQRPKRTVYALTEEGRQELYDWLKELLAEPQPEYPQFGVALSLLSVLSPEEAGRLLDKRLAAVTTHANAIRADLHAATAGGLTWVFLVEEQYRLALLDAEARFTAELIKSLTQPDYIRSWHEIFGS